MLQLLLYYYFTEKQSSKEVLIQINSFSTIEMSFVSLAKLIVTYI